MLGQLFRQARGAASAPVSQLPGIDARLCQDPWAEQLVRTGRCARVLNRAARQWPEDALQAAREALLRDMVPVPPGRVVVEPITSDLSQTGAPPAGHPVDVAPCFLDRFAVSNRQFAQFVQDGGYTHDEFWPTDLLPYVPHFTDTSGQPGPRYWSQGRPAPGDLQLPVVGVCWLEADAYARWAGKRLPDSAQWQRAATGWEGTLRYPWGRIYDPSRAHIGRGPRDGTVPVDQYVAGATPQGIFHLSGNVWEWVATSIDTICTESGPAPVEEPLAEVRGGAFDTYFPEQATCTFRSGLPLLERRPNVGFRCCVPAAEVDVDWPMSPGDEELRR
jgi:iron(II)-dependent oxidoreductase